MTAQGLRGRETIKQVTIAAVFSLAHSLLPQYYLDGKPHYCGKLTLLSPLPRYLLRFYCGEIYRVTLYKRYVK